MPDGVSKMTSSGFVMRVQLSERQFVDATITGQGFKYDEKTGALLTGMVSEISLSEGLLIGKKVQQQLVHQISNVGLEAEKMASIFGNEFWNDAKFMNEVFDKLTTLHEAIVTSHFSKVKAVGIGNDGSDRITGSRFADDLTGNAGDDVIAGARGHDRIDGGLGNDQLNGNSGNDYLTDLEGNNVLNGGAGHDRLRAGLGDDTLAGAAGNDLIYAAGGRDLVSGGKGADSFVFNAKEMGALTIKDFGGQDVLVNLLATTAEEAFKQFMETAHQDGRSVIYDSGEMHLVLQNFDLRELTEKNFADGAALYEQGFI